MCYEAVFSGEKAIAIAAAESIDILLKDYLGNISRLDTLAQVSVTAGKDKVGPLLAFHR